ncbi:MAG: hypothetical protein ABR566_05580 [Pyrinomonadaceae bacterium]
MKKKINLVGAILIAIVFFTACTVNINQPNSNANNTNVFPNENTVPLPIDESIEQNPWSVVVCSARTKSVTLSAGTNETDGEVFAIWQKDTGQREFDLPARVQSLSRIYLKGSASDKNQVEMCVLYEGRPKKRVEFDDDEDVIVSSTDIDDLDKCRCAE